MRAISPKLQARLDAASRAAEMLEGVDLPARLELLGLAGPEQDGSVVMRLFSRNVRLTPPKFNATDVSSGDPANLADRILALHYLLHESTICPSGEWISFRDLPGGATYWPSLASRSVLPLAGKTGNNLDLLRKGLDRFAWQPMTMGDFAARVQVVGLLDAALVYHLGDDELPAQADVLFDAVMRKVFCTEDVAAMCLRLCLGVLDRCDPCIGCGICDVDVI